MAALFCKNLHFFHASMCWVWFNRIKSVATDANPFRYAGQYYDKETGTYYLRARYYDPVIGRFTREDPARDGTNWYLYCYNNPIRYVDPSGKIPLETFADAVSAWFSFKELINDPSLKTAGFLAWDVAALFTPYATGSYVAKGLSLFGRADDVSDLVRAFTKVDNLADAADVFKANSKNIVGSYKDIKRVVKGLGIKGMEVHHLVEKRFADVLGIDPNEILSVALEKDTHRKLTSDFRKEIGYIYDFSNSKRTNTVDADQVWEAIVKVYESNELTQYLPELKQQLLDSASKVNEIKNWRGW